MSKYILMLLVLILGVGYVSAQGPPDHPGEICITCHQKYSDKSAITKFSPCAKSTCHKSNPTGRWGGSGPRNRYTLHLRGRICENCHSAKDGKFEIHPIHLKFEEQESNRTPVECKICHRTPEGYNSSIAYVPPYDESIAKSILINTSMRVPPWGNDCGYCHPSAKGAKRLHDIHEPVIKIACKKCHGPIIESKLGFIADITGKPLQETEEETKKERLVIREFLLLFDEIARQMLKIYKSLKT